MSTQVHRIPAFSDNYLWLIQSVDDRCFAVDPGDAQPIIDTLAQHSLSLEAILVTHHHPDHTGGIDTLKRQFNCEVYGPDSKNIPQVTRHLSGGDSVDICGIALNVIEVPGHTLDHIAYFASDINSQPALFCGDTLFAGGCGRLFEGTPKQMHDSLTTISQLPGNTVVYCAHEYTQANLKFALAVEPDNAELLTRNELVNKARARSEATVPTLIALERATNPFLRCDQQSVIDAATKQLGRAPEDSVETLAVIRGWKDNF